MQDVKPKSSQRDEDFWKSVEKMARQVDDWPQWMKGGEGSKPEKSPDPPRQPMNDPKDR